MENQHIANELKKFNVSDAAIENIRQVYMPLTIKGIDDIQGYKEVNRARIDVKNLRINVEKSRKELTADALTVQRLINEEAKRITALLKPIEDHLAKQEEAIDAEKERIKQEKIRAERAKIEAELEKERQEKLAREKVEREAEEARLRKIREAQEIESARLEAIAKEQAKTQAALKAEQDRINKDKAALEKGKAKIEDPENKVVHINVGKPNNLLRIDEMFAFISQDKDGNEGVCVFHSPLGPLPMVGADMDRMNSLKVKAKEIANASGVKIKLVKFSVRQEIETIEKN